MKKNYLLFLLLNVIISLSAQEPTGYYTSAENKTDATLKNALYKVISANYKDNGYDGLYTTYATSDVTSTGLIWDMYSTCNFSTGNKCGSYSAVCDCYNREHSIPQSWFGSASPMVADAFHVYPTDGKVNGERSNYPYGECANGTSLGSNAKGKLGTSTFPGYSGTVFEPADEYKGDFARTYFYFATRYENIMTSINGESFNKTVYPAFPQWTIDLFLKWHRQDPVSQKEINRNNAIYKRQNNRNPFIDHPELAEYIWGNKKGNLWTLNPTTDPYLSTPVSGSTVDFGTVSLQQTSTKTINILGGNLTGDLTLSLSGTNASDFSIPKFVITKTEAQTGYNLLITNNANTLGTTSAILTISGGGIPTTTVNITANVLECSNLSFSAPFSSTMSPFTQYNVSGDQVWVWKSAAYGVVMSGYTTVNNANEDWLISPTFDLEKQKDVNLVFDHTINKGNATLMKTENTLWVSNNYTSGNPNTASWTQLTIPQYPTGIDWTFVSSGKILIPQANWQKNTVFAFKYNSTESGSSTWEIKNLSLTGMCRTSAVDYNKFAGSHKIITDNNYLTVKDLMNENITVYDIYGRNIAAYKNITGDISIRLHQRGVYLLQVQKEKVINSYKILN